MSPKAKPRKKSKRTSHALPPRSWYGLRRHSEEALLTRAHKIILFTLALITLLSLGWDKVKLADARYAKDKVAQVVHQQIIKDTAERDEEISHDVAMLSQAFQYDSIDRLIEGKRDKIRSLNRRLREKISRDEQFEIQQDIKDYEQEIRGLQKKQEKLNK